VEKGGGKKYKQRGKEGAPENGKESSYSAHADGMNEYTSAVSFNKSYLFIASHKEDV